RRQVRKRRDLVTLELLRNGGVRVVEVAPLAADGEHAVLEQDHRARLHAEERPAPEALPLLRRLEQERRPLASQSQVGGYRRLGVADEGVPEGHHAVLARELAHLLEARLDVYVSGDGHSAPRTRPPARGRARLAAR